MRGSWVSRTGRNHPFAATVVTARRSRVLVDWHHGAPRRQWLDAVGGAASVGLQGGARDKVLIEASRALRRENRTVTMTHTSYGSPDLTSLSAAIQPELPFTDPWTGTLQLDGAAAVRAACELLRPPEGRVAVCAACYHGPAISTAAAGALTYPIPTDDPEADRHALRSFLRDASPGVVLVEPQWGSSRLARYWNTELLRWFVVEAKQRGWRVCADEVMCGMGRHGGGALFASKAHGLPVDGVVFGKSITSGTTPLAGAVVRRECVSSYAPTERHTFSGASPVAIAAAAATLRAVDATVHANITACERVIRERLREPLASAGIPVHGRGLLWGIEWEPGQELSVMEQCRRHGVWPYFIGRGAMVTPALDSDPRALGVSMDLLRRAVTRALRYDRRERSGVAFL